MADKFYFNSEHCQENQIMEFLQWVLGLYKLGQNNNAIFEENDIFQIILEYIVDGFDADSGSLAFLISDGHELQLIAGIDLPVGVIGTRVSVENSRMGSVIITGEPCLFNDENVNKSSRVSSAMCWPLSTQENILGALNINRGQHSEPYTEKDLERGKILISLISVVLENVQLHCDYQTKIHQLESMNAEIKSVNNKLDSARNQLLQSEKLASIGQLAAGVAHEINNPVGFINSNMSSLARYHNDLFRLLDAYEEAECHMGSETNLAAINSIKKDIDINYLRNDVGELMAESQDGLLRVKQIVQDLKDFSHIDESEWERVDLHQGINSTINVARNEIKYKAEVIKSYGNIPEIECMPSQLNQVFMNLIVNAAQSIKEKGYIKIASGRDGDMVWVSISDNGKGIPEDVKSRIFDPFFTTKPVGKGTGLGLSLSYGIVDKHGGYIKVESEVDKGTSFTVYLPIEHNGQEKLNTA